MLLKEGPLVKEIQLLAESNLLDLKVWWSRLEVREVEPRCILLLTSHLDVRSAGSKGQAAPCVDEPMV